MCLGRAGRIVAVVKLIENSIMKFEQANTYTIQWKAKGISLKSEKK